MVSSASARKWWVSLLGIAALSLFALAPTLSFPFLDWDDPAHVTHNALLLAPRSAPWWQQWTTPNLGYPTPITLLGYRLELALFGLSAPGFHAFNALLHTANALLVAALARSLGLGIGSSGVAGVLFALHPAGAEPASWVSGQKDLWATGFGLGMLWVSRTGLRARGALALALFALGIASKLTVAPLGALAGWLLAQRPGDASPAAFFAALARWGALFGAVALPVALLAWRGQESVGAIQVPYAPLSAAHAAWYALGQHAGLMLGLDAPSAKYILGPWPPPFPGRCDAWALLLLALVTVTLVWTQAERRRAATLGALVMLLGYLPVSSLLVPLTRYLADSYIYLPLSGFAWLVAAAVDELLLRLSPRLAALARAALPWAVAAALMPVFLLSSARFADDLALWQPVRQRYPGEPHVCRQWANACVKWRGPEPGLRATDACIQQFGPALFRKNRGVLLARLGRRDEARSWLEQAQRESPGDLGIQRLLTELSR